MTAAKTFSTIFHSSPIHYYCILKKSHNHLDLHAHIHINLRGVCFIFLSLSISLFLSLSLSLCVNTYVYLSLSQGSTVDGNGIQRPIHFTSLHLTFTSLSVIESVAALVLLQKPLICFLKLSKHISFCFGSVCTCVPDVL